jgi:hypothetical protein
LPKIYFLTFSDISFVCAGKDKPSFLSNSLDSFVSLNNLGLANLLQTVSNSSALYKLDFITFVTV